MSCKVLDFVCRVLPQWFSDFKLVSILLLHDLSVLLDWPVHVTVSSIALAPAGHNK